MKNSSRFSLRTQTRSFKNSFFHRNVLPFKGLLPDNLNEAIHCTGQPKQNQVTTRYMWRMESIFLSHG